MNPLPPVVVGALGIVKKGMVENIKKVSERCWDLHESSKGAQCMNRMIDLSD